MASPVSWLVGVLLAWNIETALCCALDSPTDGRRDWNPPHRNHPSSNAKEPLLAGKTPDDAADRFNATLRLRLQRNRLESLQRVGSNTKTSVVSKHGPQGEKEEAHGTSGPTRRRKSSGAGGRTMARRSDDRRRHVAVESRDRFSFLSLASFASVRLRLTSAYAISFQIKSDQQNGLLLFSGTRNLQFLAIELIDGQVQYSFDTGPGPKVLRVSPPNAINDGRWHFVEVVQPTVFEHVLHVDNASKAAVSENSRLVDVDLGDRLYLGGIPGTMYSELPKQVKSTTGFRGCFASVTVRKESPSSSDELIAEVPEHFRDQVREGCLLEDVKGRERCSEGSCSNGGICRQDVHSYSCSCEMTSFGGKYCDDNGVTYEFGPSGGLIVYAFDDKELMNTRQDSIAFGFVTSQSDAVLLRIASDSSNDYIEVELIDGNVFVVYNVGTADHPIGEPFNKVNDNSYHVLRFYRSGANSTLQLDDLPIQTKFPSGRQLLAFNGMDKVFVGGHRDAMGKLIKPFRGTISGLFVNQRLILEMASRGDAQISVVGDVQRIEKVLTPSSYIRTSSNTAVVRLMSYNRTSAINSDEHSDPCTEDGDKSRCHYARSHFISSSSSSSSSSTSPPLSSASPAHLRNRQTTRSPHSESSAEYHKHRNGSRSGTRCKHDQNDCSDTVTGPTGRYNRTAILVDGSASTYNISLNSQKSELGTRTHPMFLSHLEPASNPTNIVTNVTDSNREINLNVNIELTEQQDSPASRSTVLPIGVTVGLAIGAVLLLIVVASAAYRYRNRDEGTYRIGEGNGYDPYNSKPLIHLNGRAKYSREKVKDNKEWYV